MALRWQRWLDHLPPWLAWGAAASTGVYDPGEIALMALPLAAAAVVEGLRRDLSGIRRWLEAGALGFFVFDLFQGRGIFPVAIHTLFLLAGLRLALPRERPQRRQLLLMGFLLFLTSAVSTTDPVFLAWAVAWLLAAMAALLQQSWEASAVLRPGLAQPPPLQRTPMWALGAFAFGSVFFLVLPRVSLGLRPVPFLGLSSAFGQAGLSDHLDLSGQGPIQPNPEVVLRIIPPRGEQPGRDPRWTEGLGLLRGVVLESVRGFRWEVSEATPDALIPPILGDVRPPGNLRQVEFFLSPTPRGILPLPYGLFGIERPPVPLRRGSGASLRWRYPTPRALPLQVGWRPDRDGPPEPRLGPARWAQLTRLEPEHEAARRWSLRLAPQILQAPDLARTLEAALRGWRYTLDNPSGRAANPLEDFLDRTQAGHCEYFASAMALMLRARGVPARVVNGYRLGPWIAEGGYYRVSQDEAHSWVEYWDQGAWHVADPTPAAPAAGAEGGTGLGLLSRWADALRYRWDRYVVRFSDQDQQAGFGWLRDRLSGWTWRWTPPARSTVGVLGSVATLWLLWRTRAFWRPRPAGPDRIKALWPLLARLRRKVPPVPGETARSWLLRLGTHRPDRWEALVRLADAVDAETYGGAPRGPASALARTEAGAWRRWRPGPPLE
jgi:transglutaminase-like putative cysteine protease